MLKWEGHGEEGHPSSGKRQIKSFISSRADREGTAEMQR